MLKLGYLAFAVRRPAALERLLPHHAGPARAGDQPRRQPGLCAGRRGPPAPDRGSRARPTILRPSASTAATTPASMPCSPACRRWASPRARALPRSATRAGSRACTCSAIPWATASNCTAAPRAADKPFASAEMPGGYRTGALGMGHAVLVSRDLARNGALLCRRAGLWRQRAAGGQGRADPGARHLPALQSPAPFAGAVRPAAAQAAAPFHAAGRAPGRCRRRPSSGRNAPRCRSASSSASMTPPAPSGHLPSFAWGGMNDHNALVSPHARRNPVHRRRDPDRQDHQHQLQPHGAAARRCRADRALGHHRRRRPREPAAGLPPGRRARRCGDRQRRAGARRSTTSRRRSRPRPAA